MSQLSHTVQYMSLEKSWRAIRTKLLCFSVMWVWQSEEEAARRLHSIISDTAVHSYILEAHFWMTLPPPPFYAGCNRFRALADSSLPSKWSVFLFFVFFLCVRHWSISHSLRREQSGASTGRIACQRWWSFSGTWLLRRHIVGMRPSMISSISEGNTFVFYSVSTFNF